MLFWAKEMGGVHRNPPPLPLYSEYRLLQYRSSIARCIETCDADNQDISHKLSGPDRKRMLVGV
jgi:hypothetical protein